MTATYIFWIFIVWLCAYVLWQIIKRGKKVTITNEANDPQNEKIPYQYFFKHPSGRTYSKGMTEGEAINFAQQHPYWYVTLSREFELQDAYWERSSYWWNLYE